jgi:hypothetical protein
MAKRNKRGRGTILLLFNLWCSRCAGSAEHNFSVQEQAFKQIIIDLTLNVHLGTIISLSALTLEGTEGLVALLPKR